MDCMNFVFVPEGITRAKLNEHYGRMYRKFFRRPDALVRQFGAALQSPDSCRRLMAGIGDYWKFVRELSEPVNVY